MDGQTDRQVEGQTDRRKGVETDGIMGRWTTSDLFVFAGVYREEGDRSRKFPGGMEPRRYLWLPNFY